MKRNDASKGAGVPVGNYALSEGETLRLEAPREVVVHVTRGRIWITEEGVFDDIIIGAGDSFKLQRPGTAVIEAWKSADMLLTSPHGSAYAARIVKFGQPIARRQAVNRWWRGARIAARMIARRAWKALRPPQPSFRYY